MPTVGLHQRHEQTEGRTTYDSNTALQHYVHRAVKTVDRGDYKPI